MGSDSATMITAYGAAATYSISLVSDQNWVASVRVPVGASSSVDSPSRIAAQPLICAGVG